MYIDSHAHLFREHFGDDTDDTIRRAHDAGVVQIVVPGTNVETSREAVGIADRHEGVYACVGVHPHDASKATAEALREVEELSHHSKVVAIGEIGLDFHYDLSPREVQREVFAAQIDIAVRRHLPMVVHTRESIPEAIAMATNAARHFPEWNKGVFHCFSGTEQEARVLFASGFWVSYPGIVTFKNSPVLATLKAIGIERVLLETDAPYLAPVPYRGKRNEPSHIPRIAQTIAEIVGISLDEVARQTTEHARTLFGLPHLSTVGHGEAT